MQKKQIASNFLSFALAGTSGLIDCVASLPNIFALVDLLSLLLPLRFLRLYRFLGLLFFLCGFGDRGHAFRSSLFLLGLLFFGGVLIQLLGHFLLLLLHFLLLVHLRLSFLGTFRLLVLLSLLLHLSLRAFRFHSGPFTFFGVLSSTFGGLSGLSLIFQNLLFLSLIFLSLGLSSPLSFRLGGRFRVENLDSDVFARFLVSINLVPHLVIERVPLSIDPGNVRVRILPYFLEADEKGAIGGLGIVLRVLGLDALPDRLAG